MSNSLISLECRKSKKEIKIIRQAGIKIKDTKSEKKQKLKLCKATVADIILHSM